MTDLAQHSHLGLPPEDQQLLQSLMRDTGRYEALITMIGRLADRATLATLAPHLLDRDYRAGYAVAFQQLRSTLVYEKQRARSLPSSAPAGGIP